MSAKMVRGGRWWLNLSRHDAEDNERNRVQVLNGKGAVINPPGVDIPGTMCPRFFVGVEADNLGRVDVTGWFHFYAWDLLNDQAFESFVKQAKDYGNTELPAYLAAVALPDRTYVWRAFPGEVEARRWAMTEWASEQGRFVEAGGKVNSANSPAWEVYRRDPTMPKGDGWAIYSATRA